GIGRARWKIENEGFNVHKNQGYELEHNFGHGQKTLAMVFYWLNLLAFVAHTILAMGDPLLQQCRMKAPRRDVWESLRMGIAWTLVASWSALLRAYLALWKPRPP
ncbi:MAG: ISNCY family transposase, partial [Acidobacteria bacterium]|nr:ISNCY family transposase [Acidobacteriota bacterium]